MGGGHANINENFSAAILVLADKLPPPIDAHCFYYIHFIMLYKMTTIPRAFIYIRTCSPEHLQSKILWKEQRQKCVEYCETNGYHYEIIEQNTSADMEHNELYSIIQRKMVQGDYLVLYSLSHLARRQTDAHNLIEMMQKKSCQLTSLQEDINPRTRNEMFVGLYAWAIEQMEFSSDISQARDKILTMVSSMPNAQFLVSQFLDGIFDR